MLCVSKTLNLMIKEKNISQYIFTIVIVVNTSIVMGSLQLVTSISCEKIENYEEKKCKIMVSNVKTRNCVKKPKLV